MANRRRQRIPTGRNYRYPSKWTEPLIKTLFATSVKEGVLGLQFEDEIVEVGSGKYAATIAPPSFLRLVRLLLRPDYRVPSYFTKGFWCCEHRKLYDVLELLITQKRSPLHSWFRLFDRSPIRDRIVYRLFPLKVKQNIATHYNTSPDFMKLILGQRLEYTCAFFDDDHQSLDAAQENKINTIIHRLGLSREHHVLDMGCGWGQIAEAVAKTVGARVTGINLSENQVEFAKNNRSSDLVDFILTDYERFHAGRKFDRIYSIGMLEHIGRGLLGNYFRKISELLAPNGRALVHCIVRKRQESTNSWIDDEVFPGAYIPQLSDVIRHIDRSELQIEQVFVHDKSNYFRTLLAWTNNFHRNERELENIISKAVPQADVEAIMRIWEFYLHGSRLVFSKRNGDCYNVQVILRRLDDASGDSASERDQRKVEEGQKG
jgi:cyclopropane-fatty-acyl-phospholipid synthase